MLEGNSCITHEFNGYVVGIKMSFYCGNAYTKDNRENSMAMYLLYDVGGGYVIYLCDKSSWRYNYTWIPPPFAEVGKYSVIPSDVSR